MTTDSKPRRKNKVARVLKAIGHLTNPTTTTGKAIAWWEKGVTGAMDKLARNDLYLNAVGRMMEQGFVAQAQSIRAMEDWLRLFRLPTASDVISLREQVSHLNDQVEAMSAQLESLIEALEAEKKGSPKGPTESSK